jgi:hypothetical protein
VFRNDKRHADFAGFPTTPRVTGSNRVVTGLGGFGVGILQGVGPAPSGPGNPKEFLFDRTAAVQFGADLRFHEHTQACHQQTQAWPGQTSGTCPHFWRDFVDGVSIRGLFGPPLSIAFEGGEPVFDKGEA